MQSASKSSCVVLKNLLSTTYVLPGDELSTLVHGGSPAVTGRRSDSGHKGRDAEENREAHCKEDFIGLIYSRCAGKPSGVDGGSWGGR